MVQQGNHGQHEQGEEKACPELPCHEARSLSARNGRDAARRLAQRARNGEELTYPIAVVGANCKGNLTILRPVLFCSAGPMLYCLQ